MPNTPVKHFTRGSKQPVQGKPDIVAPQAAKSNPTPSSQPKPVPSAEAKFLPSSQSKTTPATQNKVKPVVQIKPSSAAGPLTPSKPGVPAQSNPSHPPQSRSIPSVQSKVGGAMSLGSQGITPNGDKVSSSAKSAGTAMTPGKVVLESLMGKYLKEQNITMEIQKNFGPNADEIQKRLEECKQMMGLTHAPAPRH